MVTVEYRNGRNGICVKRRRKMLAQINIAKNDREKNKREHNKWITRIRKPDE